ncbi:ISL3 family transposase [Thermaerobacter sp. PB12/4term]|nr:ISL3 family transposase [Thermaerobacter sp. PB12/4term]
MACPPPRPLPTPLFSLEPVHDRKRRWRRILHTWCDGRPVYLRVRARRFACTACGKVFTERLPGIPPWARRSQHAEATLLAELAGRSFRSAAQHTGTHPGVLRRALLRHVPGQVDVRAVLADCPEVVLSVDEHSFRRQDMVVTIACVWPRRRLLAILPDDRVETLGRYMRGVPEDVQSRIRAVCIDLRHAWRRAIQRALPGVTIVVDRFHVIQDANRRVDEARLVEQQVTGRKIPRWPLVKNEEDLTRTQASQLAEIRERHPNVAHFHWVKEQLRAFHRAGSRKEAERILSRIILNAEEAGDAALVLWGGTLRAWRAELVAYHTHRVTSGHTEGVHTKIKLLKRLSYGFRNRQLYVRKMLLAFAPLAWLTASPHFLT